MALFGSVTALVNGTMQLDPIAGQQYWWVQNMDSVPLTVTFAKAGDQPNASYVLNPQNAPGYAGGEIDSYQIGWNSSVILTSTKASHSFLSGATTTPYITDQRNT